MVDRGQPGRDARPAAARKELRLGAGGAAQRPAVPFTQPRARCTPREQETRSPHLRSGTGRGDRAQARASADTSRRSGVGRLGTLALRTLADSREDRILGVAGEVAFFTLLSIPPLLLVLAGSAGFVGDLIGPGVSESLQQRTVSALGTFLAPDTMDDLVRPAVESLYERGRADIISLGALFALWSASGAGAHRGHERRLRHRGMALAVAPTLIALGLTAGGITALAVFVPLLVSGPRLGETLAARFGLPGVVGAAWRLLYWPIAAASGIGVIATLYHVGPNWKTPWRRDLPGALLAAVTWLAAAVGLRAYVGTVVDEGIFGSLAAPIVLMLWLYVSAVALLIGAELNAEVERMWPSADAGPKAGAGPLPAARGDGT